MSNAAHDTAHPSDREIDRLRELVQTFVRSFGLLVTKETPCGHPLSPSHAHALMVLLERARRRSRTSQADLGAVLGIDKSNVARLCARMELAAHVVQVRSPDDGRSRLVRLTREGTRLARRIERASRDRFRRIAGRVAASERQALLDSLALLNAAVETHGEEQENT
jgi:DNA-binding MarR family transcriptional regulator